MLSASENIGTVYGYTGGDVTLETNIDFTDPTTFSWAYQVTKRYEMYELQELEFEYIPNCSTTTVGQVCMYFEYDPLEAPVSDFNIAMSQHGAVAGPPWQGFKLRPSMDGIWPKRKYLDVNSNGNDRRFSTAGKLIVRTTGAAADETSYGRIQVRYRLRLLIPQMQNLLDAVRPRTVNITTLDGQQTLTSGTEARVDLELTPDGIENPTQAQSGFEWVSPGVFKLGARAAAKVLLDLDLSDDTVEALDVSVRTMMGLSAASITSTSVSADEVGKRHYHHYSSVTANEIQSTPYSTVITNPSTADKYFGFYTTVTVPGGGSSVLKLLGHTTLILEAV